MSLIDLPPELLGHAASYLSERGRRQFIFGTCWDMRQQWAAMLATSTLVITPRSVDDPRIQPLLCRHERYAIDTLVVCGPYRHHDAITHLLRHTQARYLHLCDLDLTRLPWTTILLFQRPITLSLYNVRMNMDHVTELEHLQTPCIFPVTSQRTLYRLHMQIIHWVEAQDHPHLEVECFKRIARFMKRQPLYQGQDKVLDLRYNVLEPAQINAILQTLDATQGTPIRHLHLEGNLMPQATS